MKLKQHLKVLISWRLIWIIGCCLLSCWQISHLSNIYFSRAVIANIGRPTELFIEVPAVTLCLHIDYLWKINKFASLFGQHILDEFHDLKYDYFPNPIFIDRKIESKLRTIKNVTISEFSALFDITNLTFLTSNCFLKRIIANGQVKDLRCDQVSKPIITILGHAESSSF